EPLYLIPYRDSPAVTISKSTETDLRRLRFRGSIRVMPIGVPHVPEPTRQKPQVSGFVYVGRLAPSKRVADIIRAFAIYKDANGQGTLHIVGTGEPRYSASLRRL